MNPSRASRPQTRPPRLRWPRSAGGYRHGIRLRVALGLLSLASTACDRDSPTERRTPEVAGPVSIVFEDPAGLLRSGEAQIRGVLEATFERAGRQIPIDALTILVVPDSGRVIPGWGVGGYAYGPSTIEIAVDSGFASGPLFAERLAQVAAHEMHHAARSRGPGYGVSLFEAIVSEGLADHFSIELLGGPWPPWVDALSAGETETYWRLAEPELDGPYDHGRWFFGEHPGIPRWTGYTLGFRLVGAHLAEHSTTAAQLVHAPASTFRD